MRKLVCLLLTVLSCDVMAQITTASLRGVVNDSSDQILAGAVVTLSHPVTGTVYTVATDAEGHYSIHGIRPDNGYRLEVNYVGYKSYFIDDMVLHVGDTRVENITMKEDSMLDAVVVASSSREDADMLAKFDEKTIELIPSVSRSLYDIVRLVPEAMATKNGGMSYGGVNNRYNSFMINGMANSDMYGLSTSGTNGGLSNANPVAMDAISQIQVAVAPYDVRLSGFGGGVLNAVTKSGTNEFRGSAYTYYNNQSFYGSHPAGIGSGERNRLEEQTTQIYGVTLGGPIVKDKLFFFVSGEYDFEQSPSSYYPGYEGVSITTDELDRISARYKALTGFDGGGYGRRDVRQRAGSLLAVLDWNINRNNRLSASYSYLDARAEDYGNSLTTFTFAGSGYANYSRAHYVGITLESRLADRMHNTFRAGYSRVADGRDPDGGTTLPSVIIKNTGTTGGVTTYIGTDRYAGTNALTQNVVTLTDDLIVDRGAHSITMGMHHELYNIHNIYVANAYGTYTYNSIDDFENDMAAVYEYNYSDPDVTGSTVWGPRFRAAELNFYLQDRWSLGRRLLLTYGVRVTLPLIFNTPTANESFNSSAIATGNGVRVGDVPQSQVLFSPRVGLSWYKQTAAGRIDIAGGAGIFTGRVPFVWIVNNYSNTGVEQKGLRLTGESQNGQITQSAADFTVTPSPTDLSNTKFMLNVMDRKFRYPQNLKANLSADFTTHDGWNIGVEALYTKTLYNAVFRNLAVRSDGATISAVSPAAGSEANSLPLYSAATNDYSAVYYMGNTSRGYSYSLSAHVAKDFAWGLSLYASYIFGHSYAVCDVPSSSSSTNWNTVYATDLNNSPLSFSIYDVPHKLSVALGYTKRYARMLEASAGLVYQMTSGQRYSLCFGESVDFNGDAAYGSTLMYIPTEQELGMMSFADETSRQAWNDFIESDPYLRTHRGSFSERNALQAPTEHRVDLHLAHGFYFGGASKRKVVVSLDIMNFGNLLCNSWGTYYNTSGWRLQPVTVTAVDNGTPVYRFTGAKLTPNDLLSRWHMQIGARVVF